LKRAGQVATSSSADDGFAPNERGSIGAPGPTEIDTVGTFAPHDPVLNVRNFGSDRFPSESVTTTLTCQFPPATSGTNDGVGDEADDNVALLPAGREAIVHAYVNVGADRHDDDALTPNPTESPLKTCPGA
jgi:hypothetical protein